MSNEKTIQTIASVAFPGAYLQMDGKGLTTTLPHGSESKLSVGHGAGPLEQFKISQPPADGSDFPTSFESVAYPGVYLRMDGSGVTTATELGGGIVNKNYGCAGYEKFILRHKGDGKYAVESVEFPGVYLRLSMGTKPGERGPVVNCQKAAYDYELFRLETPPATQRLRVLSYNTHLMQDSFLETGTDKARDFVGSPFAVFEDEARRDHIVTYVLESLADIVSLQEVWSPNWEEDFINALKHAYPYSCKGGIVKAPLATTTSGLVLCSKFELLPNPFFGTFPDMGSPDNFSNKGALGATAVIPGFGKIRIGTAHTTGAARDIQFLADKAVNGSDEHRALPAMMMGDFNMSWTPGGLKHEYVQLKKILSFPGTNLYAASDAWIAVHGQKTDPDPYTIKMRENTIHQLFSPERDTEPDDRMDYLWVKPSKERVLSPVSASVPRKRPYTSVPLTYTSKHWHWAHKNKVERMPSAAVLGGRLCVVSANTGFLVVPLIPRGILMISILDEKTNKWVHRDTNFNTSAPPGIVAFNNKFHLFYRDEKSSAIFHRSSSDGETWTEFVNVGFNTGGGVCPIVFDGQLYLFYVHPAGRGGRIVYRTRGLAGDDWASGWSDQVGQIDINTRSDISAAVLGKRLCIVAKDNDDTDGKSSGVKYGVLDKAGGGGWKCGHPDGLNTSASPGIVAVGDRFRLYYRHHDGNAVYTAWSSDGQNWQDRDQNTLHDGMHPVGGVCPILFQDKVWLFYPYIGKYYPDGLMIHTQMPDVQVDLSDHYPLLVEMEMKTRSSLLNVLVHVENIGTATYCDGEWAGTGGDNRRIEGFQLNRLADDITLEYMAHVEDSGDTGWVEQGKFVGTRDKAKAIEGFAIRLTGDAASKYELSYKAYLGNSPRTDQTKPAPQDEGETPLVKGGEFCGTKGKRRQVQAIWIKLERK